MSQILFSFDNLSLSLSFLIHIYSILVIFIPHIFQFLCCKYHILGYQHDIADCEVGEMYSGSPLLDIPTTKMVNESEELLRGYGQWYKCSFQQCAC